MPSSSGRPTNARKTWQQVGRRAEIGKSVSEARICSIHISLSLAVLAEKNRSRQRIPAILRHPQIFSRAVRYTLTAWLCYYHWRTPVAYLQPLTSLFPFGTASVRAHPHPHTHTHTHTLSLSLSTYAQPANVVQLETIPPPPLCLSPCFARYMALPPRLLDLPVPRGTSRCPVREPLLRVKVLRSRAARRAQGAASTGDSSARAGDACQDGLGPKADAVCWRIKAREGGDVNVPIMNICASPPPSPPKTHPHPRRR